VESDGILILKKDGAGPISAIIDSSASGKFSRGVEAEVAERMYPFPFRNSS
jgi:hypothetical protein